MTQEQADEAVEIAKLVNGLAADATAASVTVQGTADVAQTKEGVWQMIVKVARAADPTVAIEEVAEAWIKRAYKQEQLVPADLNDARARWHAEQGEADVAVGLEGEALERANVEWFSKRVIDYAVANRETVLPGGWGAWLRTLGEKLKEFLRGATRMRKLMRDGKLDPELESWMRGALGLQGEAESFAITGERAAAQAARGNAEAAPVVDEVDAEMMETATADAEFPKITPTDAGDFLVRAFDGSMIGSSPTIEGAQQMALEWFDRWAREQERQAAREEAGEEATNEIMNVVQRVGGLPAPSVEPTFAGELRAIRESLGTARALRVFRKSAKDLDYVRQAVNENGFAFETVTDFLDALDRSSRGEPVYGKEGGDEQVTFALTGVPQNAQQSAQATAQALRARQLAATQAMAARLAAGYKAKHVKAVRLTTQATIRSRLLMPVYSRLAIISPRLAQRLRRFEYDNGIALRDAFKRIEPFLAGMEKMRDADRETLDLALKNGDEQTRDQMLAAYRLTQAFADVEALIAELADKAEAAGFTFERISGAYFPRKVNDLDGLRAFYHLSPKGGVIEQALKDAADAAAAQGRVLTAEEVGVIVNNTLQRPPGQGATPGNLKARKIDIVEPDVAQFYAGTAEALIGYVERMNSAIQKRAFFGKALVTMQAQNGGTYQSNAIAVEASVGKVVEDLIAAGEMTRQQQAEAVAMLEARFNQQASSPFIRGFKALSYMSTMGQVTSAMTQLTDLAFSMYENGVYETMVAAARAVTRTSPVTRDSVGLDRIAEEFRDTGKLHRALDRVFRITGIHFMDMIGKETIMNAKFAQLAKQAKAGRLSAKARAMIDASFGPAAARVIGDLAARRKNEDTLFAVYSILADYQPINLSEYPEAYLRHPNGRVFYMLKTFTIKQLDSVRREALSLIVHGNAKQKALGFKNLIHLCGLLFLIGMPVDWLKDFVMNRDPYLPDIAVDNLFKMLGVNRWNMYQFRERKNPVEAALMLAAPPAPFFVYPGQDAQAIVKKLAEGDEIKPMEFETWRILPFLGAPIYWYAGGGPAKVEKRRTLREREAMLLRGS